MSTHFGNQRILMIGTAARPTLSDDVRRELVLSETQHIAFDLIDDTTAIVQHTMLDHGLNDIVAVLFVDEYFHMHVQLFKHRTLLFFGAMLEYTLNDATAVRMCRQIIHLKHRFCITYFIQLNHHPLIEAQSNVHLAKIYKPKPMPKLSCD